MGLSDLKFPITALQKQKAARTSKDHRKRTPAVFSFCGGTLSHHLRHKVSHSCRCFLLLLPGGVGVSSQRGPRIVVSQHGGNRFGIYTILQCHGSKGVAEIVEADMFQSGVYHDGQIAFSFRIK